MAICYVNSPLGFVRLCGTDSALTEAKFSLERGAEEDPELLSRAKKELSEYFEGKRQEFTVTLAPEGTEFQLAVWQALFAIPYGAHRTYAELAAQIGKPRAARAVGNAVGANPCVIFLPCHRVLAKDGLGGFSCGLWRKEALLELEGIPF